MKKVLSILVLLTFLFNVGGYYLAFQILRYRSFLGYSEKIDHKDYSEAEIQEFKIPLSLPYPLQEHDYVRAHGEIEFNGEYFTLAEQKIFNDTLYVRCIRNVERRQLHKAFTDYAQASNAGHSGNQDKTNSLLSKLIKEYRSITSPQIICQFGWHREIEFSNPAISFFEIYPEISSPPPDRLV